jgi:diguanylate cyclase (GGDEF)-like protein/PAS domain S-box-containing protein
LSERKPYRGIEISYRIPGTNFPIGNEPAMTDLKTAGKKGKAGKKPDSTPSDYGSRLEKLQYKYDELNTQVDDILTETMDRSNRIVMESEIGHLITYQVFNASSDGIWAIDRNRKIMRVNKKLLRLFNKKAEHVIGRQCNDTFPGACPLEDTCPWKSIEKGEPVVEREITLEVAPDKQQVFRVAFTPLSNLEGVTIGLVETFNDITMIRQAEDALQRANRELEKLANEDGLTRIANRRTFDNFLEQEWRRQKRAGNPVSLIMCDVDFFKKYNDTYGHQAGDMCLASIADVIKKSIHRGSDLTARYGGEEFVVLLPETDIAGARHVVDRIRSSMEEKRITHSNSETAPCVTLSFGIASVVPADDMLPEALIKTADQMLYRAKQQGRNRAVSADENVPVPEDG